MPVVIPQTLSEDFIRARGTSATDNGFPSRIPTITKPSGVGNSAAQATASAVFDLRNNGAAASVSNSILMVFFGVGSDNNTFSARLAGWRRARPRPGDSTTPPALGGAAEFLWIPVPLFEVAVTLSSTQPGIVNSLIGATSLFADTITLTGTTANDDVSVDIVSPANDTIAHLVVDVKGFELVEPIFTTGGSATSCNALLAKY